MNEFTVQYRGSYYQPKIDVVNGRIQRYLIGKRGRRIDLVRNRTVACEYFPKSPKGGLLSGALRRTGDTYVEVY